MTPSVFTLSAISATNFLATFGVPPVTTELIVFSESFGLLIGFGSSYGNGLYMKLIVLNIYLLILDCLVIRRFPAVDPLLEDNESIYVTPP